MKTLGVGAREGSGFTQGPPVRQGLTCFQQSLSYPHPTLQQTLFTTPHFTPCKAFRTAALRLPHLFRLLNPAAQMIPLQPKADLFGQVIFQTVFMVLLHCLTFSFSLVGERQVLEQTRQSQGQDHQRPREKRRVALSESGFLLSHPPCWVETSLCPAQTSPGDPLLIWKADSCRQERACGLFRSSKDEHFDFSISLSPPRSLSLSSL